jgi:hypothetical protein
VTPCHRGEEPKPSAWTTGSRPPVPRARSLNEAAGQALVRAVARRRATPRVQIPPHAHHRAGSQAARTTREVTIRRVDPRRLRRESPRYPRIPRLLSPVSRCRAVMDAGSAGPGHRWSGAAAPRRKRSRSHGCFFQAKAAVSEPAWCSRLAAARSPNEKSPRLRFRPDGHRCQRSSEIRRCDHRIPSPGSPALGAG